MMDNGSPSTGVSDRRNGELPAPSSGSTAPAQTRPLHVAMVVRSFSENGGLELYAHRTVEGLLERGHRVTVICEVSDSKFEHERLEKLYFAAAPRGASKAIRIKHHFQAASKFVADHGPFDVVHSQHLPMDGADAVTFHNHTANRLMEVGQGWEQLLNSAKMIYSRAYKLRYSQDEILCRAKVLLFPAAVCRDDFAATYKLNDRPVPPSYVVAHPGASFPGPQTRAIATGATATAAASMSKTSRDVFTFLFVGKGFRKKGLDILLRACQKLHQDGVSFRLIIAGLKAKPVDKLRLSFLGIKHAVEYLGFRKDMQNVYAQANATILPSRIEPFGMAPVQGMIHGLVPIVSGVSGVAEVLTDGVDSLILKNHLSADELAALMKRLIESPDTLGVMSERARETATELTWSRTVDETLRAYQMVLANKQKLQ